MLPQDNVYSFHAWVAWLTLGITWPVYRLSTWVSKFSNFSLTLKTAAGRNISPTISLNCLNVSSRRLLTNFQRNTIKKQFKALHMAWAPCVIRWYPRVHCRWMVSKMARDLGFVSPLTFIQENGRPLKFFMKPCSLRNKLSRIIEVGFLEIPLRSIIILSFALSNCTTCLMSCCWWCCCC